MSVHNPAPMPSEASPFEQRLAKLEAKVQEQQEFIQEIEKLLCALLGVDPEDEAINPADLAVFDPDNVLEDLKKLQESVPCDEQGNPL